jgi:hypothetical protein
MRYLEGEYTFLDRPLPWQIAGLQQTASGYGSKLTSSRVVKLADGRERRVYITQYSNAGTAWIVLDGERVYLRG